MYEGAGKLGMGAGAAGGAGVLAFTGASWGWFIAVGLMLVVTGLLLVRMTRMRRVRPASGRH